jgi:L-alanine-DL-glutamate epimerase-like enolase superfamily enzyme
MENLKIDTIEVIELNIALKEPISISLGTNYLAENIIIKIHADNGLIGTGEASPEINITGETQAAAIEIAKLLAAGLKGKDPLAIEDRIGNMDRIIDGNYTIKSA